MMRRDGGEEGNLPREFCLCVEGFGLREGSVDNWLGGPEQITRGRSLRVYPNSVIVRKVARF